MTTLRAVSYLQQSSDLDGTGDTGERQPTDCAKLCAAQSWSTVQAVSAALTVRTFGDRLITQRHTSVPKNGGGPDFPAFVERAN